MICNLCGLSCSIGTGDLHTVDAGLLDIKVHGQYESTPGNGWGALDDRTMYNFSLCEFCLDWLFSQFKVPVSVFDTGTQEIESFQPAAVRVSIDQWRKHKLAFFEEASRRDIARRCVNNV